MNNIREIVVKLLPATVINWVRVIKGTADITNSIVYRGNYRSWQEALGDSKGYEKETILTTTRDALLKVKNGEAVYERDSILFDEVQYSWALLASLLKVASVSHGRLHLVDFGGSLGTTYYQNRHFLQGLSSVKWHVVEQKHVVECGQTHFQDDTLQFYHSVDAACAAEQGMNCVVLSGVLQCLEKPHEQLRAILARQFEYIIIDRTSFIQDDTDRLCLQIVPPCIYDATYPCWFFNEEALLSVFNGKYELIASFNSYADNPTSSEDGKTLYWKGFFLKLKVT